MEITKTVLIVLLGFYSLSSTLFLFLVLTSYSKLHGYYRDQMEVFIQTFKYTSRKNQEHQKLVFQNFLKTLGKEHERN